MTFFFQKCKFDLSWDLNKSILRRKIYLVNEMFNDFNVTTQGCPESKQNK